MDAELFGERLNTLVKDVIDAERRVDTGDAGRCAELVGRARRDHDAIVRLLEQNPELASAAMRRMATALGTIIEQLERRAFPAKGDAREVEAVSGARR